MHLNRTKKIGATKALTALILGISGLCPVAYADQLPIPTVTTTGEAMVAFGPDASAFASAAVGPNTSGGSYAQLIYNFEIQGPSGVGVLLDITGAALVTVTGADDSVQNNTNFLVSATIMLEGETLQSAFCQSEYADCSYGVAETLVQGVASDTQYQITLTAIAEASNVSNDATTVLTALADPILSFDPSFNSDGFTIVLSPGIGNSTVPEPGTGALAGAGALVALAVFRKKRAARLPQ